MYKLLSCRVLAAYTCCICLLLCTFHLLSSISVLISSSPDFCIACLLNNVFSYPLIKLWYCMSFAVYRLCASWEYLLSRLSLNLDSLSSSVTSRPRFSRILAWASTLSTNSVLDLFKSRYCSVRDGSIHGLSDEDQCPAASDAIECCKESNLTVSIRVRGKGNFRGLKF